MLYQAALEALDADHCGACRRALDHVERYFQAFFYEQVNDPWVRQVFIDARGWCPTHAWRKPGMHDATGIAVVYEHLLQETLKALRGAVGQTARAATRSAWPWPPPVGGDLARSLASWREPRQDCPACTVQWQAEDNFTFTVVDALAVDEFRRRYQESFGLCVPHLIQTLRRMVSTEALDWLVACERENLERLAWELSEFIRKHDYRYAKEPRGRESTSWRRVVEKLNGAPGLVRRG
jgi:hypothetical protein